MLMKPHVIHERSNIIPINKSPQNSLQVKKVNGEYSLKQHFFDPSKSSPPNVFINNLHKRMMLYNTNIYSEVKDINLDNE